MSDGSAEGQTDPGSVIDRLRGHLRPIPGNGALVPTKRVGCRLREVYCAEVAAWVMGVSRPTIERWCDSATDSDDTT